MTTTDTLPALLDSVRAIDRTVLDVGRKWELRPMEVYLLLSLSDEPDMVSTAHMGDNISASSSQAKQVALRLQEGGFVRRIDRTGLTILTEAGQTMAKIIANEIVTALAAKKINL